MLDKYDIERIKNGRFWSEKHQCFVEIKDQVFILPGRKVALADVKLLDIETQDFLYDLINESKTKKRLNKQTDSKGRVLLGIDAQGVALWLTPPSWDCSWYWGFGYIHSKGSHSHFSGLVGKQEYWDSEKGCFRNGEYINNIYDSLQLIETTFSYNEGWDISELFKQFYLLKEMAEFIRREKPGCNIATSPVDHNVLEVKEWNKHINTVMIPLITAKIMEILSPVKEEVKV